MEENKNESVITEETAAEGQEKPAKKKVPVSHRMPIVILMFFVLQIAGGVIGYILTSLPEVLSENTQWIVKTYFYNFIGTHIFFLLYTYFTNKEVFGKYLKGSSGNNVKMLLIGFGAGFLLNGLCVLMAYIHGDIVFMGGNMNIIQLLLAFLCVFVQSAAEELANRGFLFYCTEKRMGKVFAFILSAALFALLHIGNNGVGPLALVNIALTGVLFALFVYCFDSLWMAMAAHTAWNFNQNFLFGLPNSGIVTPVSALKLEAAKDSPFFDAGFGVEAAVTATVILIVACAVTYLIYRKNKAE